MSVDSFFFVRDEKLPTISQWQAALDDTFQGANATDARALLVKLVDADVPLVVEWMALARAIQAWLIAPEAE